MAIEYLGLSSINGPLVVLDGVQEAFFDEIVEFVVDGNIKKMGRIVELNEEKIPSAFSTDIGMPMATSFLALLYRYRITSIILNCFSIETQVSSLWKAFCCKNPRRP